MENYQQGIIQGNASGPSIWLTLSSVIFDIIHERRFKSNIISSISKQLFTLVGFAYMDNCDLIQVGEDSIMVLDSGSSSMVTGDAGMFTQLDSKMHIPLLTVSKDGAMPTTDGQGTIFARIGDDERALEMTKCHYLKGKAKLKNPQNNDNITRWLPLRSCTNRWKKLEN